MGSRVARGWGGGRATHTTSFYFSGCARASSGGGGDDDIGTSSCGPTGKRSVRAPHVFVPRRGPKTEGGNSVTDYGAQNNPALCAV